MGFLPPVKEADKGEHTMNSDITWTLDEIGEQVDSHTWTCLMHGEDDDGHTYSAFAEVVDAFTSPSWDKVFDIETQPHG